ncbi:MAG: flavodoxin family protein [Marinilabiliaceae bacterium]|jgi:multimeric flavodoxin WrbA|nr:flavodoxin family protein [Marinilabiliaceae bacterium]
MGHQKLRVLAISGSPRTESNTDRIIKSVLSGAEDAGHETQFIKLNELNFSPCQACGDCRLSPGARCKLTDDGRKVLDLTEQCDVLIFGSPIYMGGISAQAKAYIDRWYSFKDENRISELVGDRKVIGVYAQGAKDGTYHRLFETNERLFNSNNFAYLGSLVAPDYMVPEKGDDLTKKAYAMGLSL